MKTGRGYIDMNTILDEVFAAAENFRDEFQRNFHGPEEPQEPFGQSHFGRHRHFDENSDYYPNYSYPPMNVYLKDDRTMVFEFALAGFEEKDISLSFSGDYMVFSARLPQEAEGDFQNPAETPRWFKRRLKMKNIEKQKYYVPLDKYAQENVKAVFRNGILRVTVPPKDEPGQSDGIRIEIIREGV